MDTIETKIGYIYKVTAPNGKVYIGQTKNPRKRKSNYKYDKFKNQIKLWNSCQAHNWNPADTFQIIEECFVETKIIDEREIYWINFYDSYKNGLNCTSGGSWGKGYQHTDEAKQKIREFRQGKKLSESSKEKVRIAKLGTIMSDEAKQKMSEAKFNMSDETKEKIGNAHKGKILSVETKEKMSLAKKQISDETKKKMRQAKSGINHPFFGRKHSEETKEKMRQVKLNKK